MDVRTGSSVKAPLVLTGLTPATTYLLQVRALIKNTYTDWSDSHVHLHLEERRVGASGDEDVTAGVNPTGKSTISRGNIEVPATPGLLTPLTLTEPLKWSSMTPSGSNQRRQVRQ